VPEDNRWGCLIFNFLGTYYLGFQFLSGGGLLFNEFTDIGTIVADTWYHFAITRGDVMSSGPTTDQFLRLKKWFNGGTFQGCYIG